MSVPRFARVLGWLAAWLLLALLLSRLTAPGYQPADAGEFQLVAKQLGVAHPPGYPLYTLSAHAFGRIAARPALAELLGDEACQGEHAGAWPRDCREAAALGALWPWAVNLFSAALAAATLLVVLRAGWRMVGLWAAGLLGAAALGIAPTFLAQSSLANVRMPSALLTALLLAIALDWLAAARAGGPEPSPRLGVDTRLAALAFVFALAAGHHPSLVFLGLPLALAVLLTRPAVLRDLRTVLAAALAFGLGLLPQLYLPWRGAAGALLAPDDLATPAGTWRHATAAGFRGDMLYFQDLATGLDRVAVLVDALRIQLGWLGLAGVLVGLAWLLARRRAEGLLLLACAALVGALAVLYRAPQTLEYLVPAYVALALLLSGAAGALQEGLGRVPALRERARPRASVLASVLALGLALGLLWAGRARPAQVRAANPSLLREAALVRIAGCLPEDAEILTSWHYATPLWQAALDGESGREFRFEGGTVPYEAIRYVAPDWVTGDPIGETWRKRYEAREGAPTVLTNRTAQLLASGARLVPRLSTRFDASEAMSCGALPDNLFSQRDRAIALAPPGSSFAEAPVVLRAVGYSLDAWGVPTIALELEPTGAAPLEGSHGIFAQLVASRDGSVWGQWDTSVGPERLADEAGLRVRGRLVPYRDAPEGPFEIRVGMYRHGPEGPERYRLLTEGWTTSRIDPSSETFLVHRLEPDQLDAARPAPSAAQEIPFGSEMILEGWEARRDGDELIVDLDWRADRAYRSDYTVSVQAEGPGWRAQHDGTPALGAIPTLKWLPGMRVEDRHRIELPPDAEGPIRVTVGVYDAFDLHPLPVTDAARVRAGQGQRAEIAVVE